MNAEYHKYPKLWNAIRDRGNRDRFLIKTEKQVQKLKKCLWNLWSTEYQWFNFQNPVNLKNNDENSRKILNNLEIPNKSFPDSRII